MGIMLSLSYCPALYLLKAWVKGSTWIPIFDVDDKFDLGTLTRKITNFTMGIISNPDCFGSSNCVYPCWNLWLVLLVYSMMRNVLWVTLVMTECDFSMSKSSDGIFFFSLKLVTTVLHILIRCFWIHYTQPSVALCVDFFSFLFCSLGGWWSGAPTLSFNRYFFKVHFATALLVMLQRLLIQDTYCLAASSYKELRKNFQKMMTLLLHARRVWGDFVLNVVWCVQ